MILFNTVLGLLLQSFLSIREVMRSIMIGDFCSVWDLSMALLIIAVLLSILLSFVDLSQFHYQTVRAVDKSSKKKNKK